MNRKSAIRASLIGLPLLAFILYAALNWYTIEDDSIWVGAGEAAREDPFLAYTRLLARMGAPANVGREPSSLDAPPPRGTVMLGRRRLAYMTPARVNRIVRWVDAGGSLVVEPEAEAIDDPLLDALGVARVFPTPDEKGVRTETEARANAGARTDLTIDWPQLGRPLRARLAYPYALRDSRVRSDVRELRQADRVIALTFASGEGRVTVMPTLGFLRNNQVGELDHAELGWRLASAQSPALLYLRMQSPPLLDWIRRDAWPVALAAALLLVLWLGRIIPRFGPLEPAEEPPRRSLIEHIVASGRFLWSRGAGAYLLEAVRERAVRVARRRGIPTQTITAGAARARLDANSFTQQIASLQEIEERLERRKKGRT
jgi:hypothetical protein